LIFYKKNLCRNKRWWLYRIWLYLSKFWSCQVTIIYCRCSIRIYIEQYFWRV